MKQYRTLILILVFVAIAIWINLPNNPGINLGGFSRQISTRLGLDLVGGVQVLLEADLPEGRVADSETMNTAASIVENRVNGLGVEEAVVQRAGEQRIVVEIPGVEDPEQAIATIKETGLLEFIDMSGVPQQQAIAMVGTNVDTDFGQETSAGEDSTTESFPAPDVSTEITTTNSTTQTVPSVVFPTVMTGASIKTVGVSPNQVGTGYVVNFELTSEGSRVFADFTSSHVNEILGIVLDKTLISVPSVNEPITGGQGMISGNFTSESANSLAVQLRYGSLPIPLKVVESRTVGPTLGEDSLKKSLLAGLVGFGIVILFMALYYRLPGLLADVAILIYATLTFALFRYIPVTLTLPGIAGLMLSTGSALDANILIFERLKEELRAGRSLGHAIDLAWQRAWPSIRDSNISTLITCGILFWFGSAFGATIVKGFSVTLALGVAVSLFTAIIVTRTFLSLVLQYLKPTNFAKWFGI